MRILIDARYLDGTFSGIATYSTQLLLHLARIDQANEYVVLVRPGYRSPPDLGENFRFVTYAPKPVSLATLFRLGSYVDDLGVDLLHSLFPLAPLGMKTPLMVTLHDLQPLVDPDFSGRRPLPLRLGYRLFYRTMYPAVMNRAKWVATVSYTTRDNALAQYPWLRGKVLVVPSGLEKSAFDPPAVSAADIEARHGVRRPYVLYVGSTRPNKNLPNMISGFASYRRRSGDKATEFVLVVKRDRFYRDVRRRLKIEGVQDHVRVLNQVSEGDRHALVCRASLFLFATRHEGFGFPALEAMAAGVPVVAGESGALPEICGDAAWFVDPDDPESIADGMIKLLGDPGEYAMLAERGRRRAEVFDWEAAARQVRDIYQLLF